MAMSSLILPGNNQRFEEKHQAFLAQNAEWAKLVNEPTVTNDGHHVELAANIGTPDDVKGVLENGGEAVGLYRTEFLYMGRDQLPTEEEQFDAYNNRSWAYGRQISCRSYSWYRRRQRASYLELPKEMNPFLGYRAIRLCLDEQEIFQNSSFVRCFGQVHMET